MAAVISTRSHKLCIRQSDRVPLFVMQVTDGYGNAVDLTASRAWLILETVDGSPVFGKNEFGLVLEPDGSYRPELTILAPLDGIITYEWLPEETESLIPTVYDVGVHIAQVDGSTFVAPTQRVTQLIVSSGSHGFPDTGVPE